MMEGGGKRGRTKVTKTGEETLLTALCGRVVRFDCCLCNPSDEVVIVVVEVVIILVGVGMATFVSFGRCLLEGTGAKSVEGAEIPTPVASSTTR